jgi:hypothetical protein
MAVSELLVNYPLPCIRLASPAGCSPLNVPWMFPECSLNVPWMFSECSLNVPWMFPECAECSLNVPWMFPECAECSPLLPLGFNVPLDTSPGQKHVWRRFYSSPIWCGHLFEFYYVWAIIQARSSVKIYSSLFGVNLSYSEWKSIYDRLRFWNPKTLNPKPLTLKP